MTHSFIMGSLILGAVSPIYTDIISPTFVDLEDSRRSHGYKTIHGKTLSESTGGMSSLRCYAKHENTERKRSRFFSLLGGSIEK